MADVMAPIKRKKSGGGLLNDIAKVGELVGGALSATGVGSVLGAPLAAGSAIVDTLTPDEKVEEIQKKLPQAVNNLDAMKRRFEGMNQGGGFF